MVSTRRGNGRKRTFAPSAEVHGHDRQALRPTEVVTVTLVGACGTCPASTQTLKQGIERIMRDRVDGVTEVVNV